MKFGKFVGLVLALGVGVAAHAQFGVYGTYTANRLTGMQCEDLQGDCSAKNGNINLTGGWVGAYYDLRDVGPVRLGVDARWGEGHSNKSATTYGGGDGATSSQNVLGGIRASFPKPFAHVLKPYVEVAAGWTRSNVTEYGLSTQQTLPTYQVPRAFDQFFNVEGFAGLDIKLFSIMDFRAAELGYGNMNRITSSSQAGVGNGVGSVGVESISVGIVFHIPAS